MQGEERYQKIKEIGRGAFGEVYEAKDVVGNELVAIKKFNIKNQENGIEFSTIRELKILQELSHPNVVKFMNVFHKKENLHLVLELAPYNLRNLCPLSLSPPSIKSILRQLLEGLSYLHRSWIIHRDLSCNNILISPLGVVKITDFGLSKVLVSEETKHTRFVTTLWYRAPEVLFGTSYYGRAVDLWAAGCIFAEMLDRQPMFAGNNDMDQVATIFKKLGTPSGEDWPGVNYFPNYMKQPASPSLAFQKAFRDVEPQGIDLLKRLLAYSPLERISAEEALMHPYFLTGVQQASGEQLVEEVGRKMAEVRRT